MSITLEEYKKKYPMQLFTASNGGTVEYRWHRNENSDKALTLLIGTLGNSDAFYEHFDALAEKYSVLTLNYPKELEQNELIADAIAELFAGLGIKVWLLGQSLGGLIAQIMAKRHPEVVEGFVLSNTCSLGDNLSQEAKNALIEMLITIRMNLKMLKMLPMGLVKRRLLEVDPAITSYYTPDQKAHADGFNELSKATLTKDGVRHSLTMLVDLHRQIGLKKESFEFLRGKVLLLLSPDDKLFPKGAVDALIELMPDPVVDRSLTGGHIAMFLEPAEYVEKVSAFIDATGE